VVWCVFFESNVRLDVLNFRCLVARMEPTCCGRGHMILLYAAYVLCAMNKAVSVRCVSTVRVICFV